jgi:ABC-2 type transport system ATP-binding protein
MAEPLPASRYLVTERICHRYGDRHALTDVDFTLPAGTTALVGINGAGKSTLMSILAGAMRPTTGRVSIDGQDLYGRGRRNALRNVALMPQNVAFPRTMTAHEVVTHLTWMRGIPAAKAAARAREALDQVDLSERAHEKIGAMSGGMQRRVALAQALAAPASLLLLDEPSTGLDPEQRHRMVRLLKNVTDRYILLSSHILEDVVDLAQQVVVLHDGQTRFSGSLAEFTAQAPDNADLARQAEAAFLQLITRAGSAR